MLRRAKLFSVKNSRNRILIELENRKILTEEIRGLLEEAETPEALFDILKNKTPIKGVEYKTSEQLIDFRNSDNTTFEIFDKNNIQDRVIEDVIEITSETSKTIDRDALT